MAFVTQPKENILDGEALTFADLPPAAFDNNGLVYLVDGEQGSRWTLNHKKAGQYKSNGVRWVYLGVEIPQATTEEMERLISTDIRRMSPDNLNTAIDSKALPSATQDEMFHLSESSDRAISPYLVGEAIATRALPVMTLAERNDLVLTESRAISPDDLRIVVANGLPSQASTAEVTSLTGTRARLFTPANIGAAIENNSLSSMSLAERNALTETDDRTMSPNDIRVAVDSRLPPTATAAEITDLTSTDIKLLSPANIGVAIENNTLPSISLAERNALTETSDRTMSPNDLRVAIFNTRTPTMTTTERTALIETEPRAMSPEDIAVMLENDRAPVATAAEVEAMTVQSPRFMSPRDLKRAIDSRLPSMTLAERNALTETGDRAVSPNDIRVAINNTLPQISESQINAGTSTDKFGLSVLDVLKIVSTNKYRHNLRDISTSSSFHHIEHGGVYYLEGSWSTTKTIQIDTDEDVIIIGSKGATLNTGVEICIEVEKARSLAISDILLENTGNIALWSKEETELLMQRVDVDSSTCVRFDGGSMTLKDCTFSQGDATSAILIQSNAVAHNKYLIEGCVFIAPPTFTKHTYTIWCNAATEIFTVKDCIFDKVQGDTHAPIHFVSHTLQSNITILNNRVSSSHYLLYKSGVSAAWPMLHCVGNVNKDNKPFSPLGDEDLKGFFVHRTTFIRIAQQGSYRMSSPGNWTKVGTAPSNVSDMKGLQFTLPPGYVSQVIGSSSFRTPTVDGSFRWASLVLYKGTKQSDGSFTWSRVLGREQGSSNSEGVGGYDYASLSVDFTAEVSRTSSGDTYKITVDSSDPDTNYRENRVNIYSTATYIPDY